MRTTLSIAGAELAGREAVEEISPIALETVDSTALDTGDETSPIALEVAVAEAWHFVQTVFVEVKKTVDVVIPTEVSTDVTPSDVWVVVAVTGQIVTEVSIITVVMTSLGAKEVVFTKVTGVVRGFAAEVVSRTIVLDSKAADEIVETSPIALDVEDSRTADEVVETSPIALDVED